MSCWSRKSGAHGALVLLAASGGLAMAADVSFQPSGEVGAEVNSNRDLVVTGNKRSTEGYTAEAGGTLRVATPESVTTIKPQIGYADYPQNDQNSLRALMDFSSQYTSQRTRLGLFGQFDHRDTYSSELANAGFNPVNPNLPTTPETGRISVGDKRTLLTLVPNYRYAATDRMGLGFSGIYQSVDYSGANAGTRYVPYDYYSATPAVDWALSQKTEVTLGAFVSRSSDKNDAGKTDGHGLTLDFGHKWTDTFSGNLNLTAEQDDITTVKPASSRVKSKNVGATYTSTWKGEVSKFDVSVGRTFTPGGSGGTYRADQVQVEYNRRLSARTVLESAARYIRYESLSAATSVNDYELINANARVKWKLTPTWYVAGGVEYLREKFNKSGTSAGNGNVNIAFGYEGLSR